MEAYLDNSATTRCSERAKNKMVQILTEDYGNPSSLHNMGKTAEDYIKEAKEQIAKTLRCDEKEIIFTSGGTESNNMALIGGALANKRQGKHIITTAIEHASVQAPLAYLKELGYEITELSVDHDGIISLEELRDAVREDTVLVSIMMVNNEIGAVEPVEEAAKVIKAKNPDTLFHVDAIQAYGKFRICPKKMGIDLLSVSGHKIHAPKGTGFLYIRDKVKVKPIIHMDNEGKLQVIGKERGRKKSLNKIVDMAVKQSEGWENDLIMITHGDCIEDAEYVAQLVREKMGVENILINNIGTVIGSHTGPGVVAVFCMGNER